MNQSPLRSSGVRFFMEPVKTESADCAVNALNCLTGFCTQGKKARRTMIEGCPLNAHDVYQVETWRKWMVEGHATESQTIAVTLLDAYDSLVAAWSARAGWVSTAERRPMPCNWYLAGGSFGSMTAYFDGVRWTGDGGKPAIPGSITHWQPLPAPPTERGANG
jgi:hypothetical protein